jgi:hypothetical protein
LPVTCELLELDALPGVPIELLPEPIDPLLPDEPVPRSELEEPLDPLPMEPEEPLLDDPLPVLDDPLPVLFDCAPAGSATRSPATPSPATIPLLNLMFPPDVPRRSAPGPLPGRVQRDPLTLVL